MERFKTSVRLHAWYEHWHRYHFVLSLVENKVVCDIACGEGYGSSLLSSVAKSVTGVDIDKETINNAREKYSKTSNLTYIQSNAIKTDLADNQFDVVISFETLEHLIEHQQLLNEFKRILKPEGVLIISTPDKDVYSENDEGHNEYHLKELKKVEFNKLITDNFNFSKQLGQQFQLMSVIELLESSAHYKGKTQAYVATGQEQIRVKNKAIPMYLISICSDNLETVNNLPLNCHHNFADADNSLYKHYEKQTKMLILQDNENIKLTKTIEEQKLTINHLRARLGY